MCMWTAGHQIEIYKANSRIRACYVVTGKCVHVKHNTSKLYVQSLKINYINDMTERGAYLYLRY